MNDAQRYSELNADVDPCAPESRFNRYQLENVETNRGKNAYNEEDPVLSSREILAGSSVDGGPAEGSGHNIIVVSDLHLGDSLRPSEPGFLRNLARLNRALCRFLKHYARHRVDGRPWRLV